MHFALLSSVLMDCILHSNQMHRVLQQEYTDDTADLRRALDGLGGMAALTDPDMQLRALPELEQYVSAVFPSCCIALPAARPLLNAKASQHTAQMPMNLQPFMA